MAAELGTTPDNAAQQLQQGVFLTPDQLASPDWLGAESGPGNVAQNLQNASQFLADQKQIPAAADLGTFQKAVYVKGLPSVLD